MQLFCLHYAGGSCYSFDFLKKYFRQDIEFSALELPGRGRRVQENLINNMSSAVDDYVQQISANRNGEPYVIYGHSMGAILGFNVVSKMELNGDPPINLIISGSPGPGISNIGKRRFMLPDGEFKEVLRALGGVSDEVLENSELFDFFKPIIRADFRVLEDRVFKMEDYITIDTPIYALMGNEEEHFKEVCNWMKFTSGKFKFKIFKGNHFFIYRHAKEISSIVEGCFVLNV